MRSCDVMNVVLLWCTGRKASTIFVGGGKMENMGEKKEELKEMEEMEEMEEEELKDVDVFDVEPRVFSIKEDALFHHCHVVYPYYQPFYVGIGDSTSGFEEKEMLWPDIDGFYRMPSMHKGQYLIVLATDIIDDDVIGCIYLCKIRYRIYNIIENEKGRWYFFKEHDRKYYGGQMKIVKWKVYKGRVNKQYIGKGIRALDDSIYVRKKYGGILEERWRNEDWDYDVDGVGKEYEIYVFGNNYRKCRRYEVTGVERKKDYDILRLAYWSLPEIDMVQYARRWLPK